MILIPELVIHKEGHIHFHPVLRLGYGCLTMSQPETNGCLSLHCPIGNQVLREALLCSETGRWVYNIRVYLGYLPLDLMKHLNKRCFFRHLHTSHLLVCLLNHYTYIFEGPTRCRLYEY